MHVHFTGSTMNDGSPKTRRRRTTSVLIADDHDHSRSAARLVLEDGGFAVIEARTGSDALALAQMLRPRILLLDIVLPGIDGLQLTRMFRADPTMRHCSIIAITAFTGQDYRDAAFEAGCDEFVTKPVRAAELVDLVRVHARRPAHPGYERELPDRGDTVSAARAVLPAPASPAPAGVVPP
jgi:two-component system cell cycle response regulator DivK